MIEIIAEIGWNHMGDMNLAKTMIEEAAKNGANYVKFQTWSVSRLKSGPWDKDGRREIYEKAELSKEQHIYLMDICEKNGVKFLSSVFSIPDAKLLVELGCKEVKIPSFESRNIELIEYCRDYFDKIFISCGTSNVSEICKTLSLFNNSSCAPILLHCVSTYPLSPENANIRRITLLKELNLHSSIVGYSDHMEGIESAKIAIELGATIIEKHFTTDKSLPGRDNKFAILPRDLLNLSLYLDLRKKMLSGSNFINFQPSENESREKYTGRFNG